MFAFPAAFGIHVTQFIDTTDSIVSDLLEVANDLDDKAARAEQYRHKLGELTASL
jgi:hypothetical protein